MTLPRLPAERRVLDELAVLKDCTDIEMAGCEADEIISRFLRHIGYEDVAKAWQAVPKWYA